MDGYIAEIRMFAGNFAPRNWALCNGQLLAISQNTALFSLLGTTYGGNGTTNFALPDLRGRVPLHEGAGPGLSNYVLGQAGGTETVTLATTQIPAHNHALQATPTSANTTVPNNNSLAIAQDATANPLSDYSNVAPTVAMNATSIGNTGGSQPHANVQPYLAVNFIICLTGIFPSRN